MFAQHVTSETAMLQWIATYREFNLAHHDTRVRVYPGVVELVRRIRAPGCGLAW